MTVYFDSSVFLSVLNGDSSAQQIRFLLADLQKEKTKICTSIITIQEVSVGCYRLGSIAADNHGYVKKLARIEGVTRDVALTAAKLEARIIDDFKGKATEKQLDNKRRKWDCFHIATAQCLKCASLYTLDLAMLNRQSRLEIKGIKFSLPGPLNLDLFTNLP